MNKKVVYSAVFGSYDKFPYINKFEDDVDYILFTSESIKPEGKWKVLQVCREFKDDSKNSRIYKLLPHLFLSKYDLSCWIDAHLKIDFPISTLFNKFKFFMCFNHPNEIKNYKAEAERCVRLKKENGKKIKHQLDFYSRLNIEERYRNILAAGFMMRKHNDQLMVQFNNEWFSHVAAMGKRDQVSLALLRSKYFFNFNIETLNYSDFNIKIAGHRKRK